MNIIEINKDCWIGVDLDGTLAEYHGYKGPGIIGKPIPKMINRVKKWLSLGQPVKIMTARANKNETMYNVEIKSIEEWCKQHIGVVLPITNEKDYKMIELWDDLAIQVIKNTGERIDGKQ